MEAETRPDTANPLNRAIADLAKGNLIVVSGASEGAFMMVAAHGVGPGVINDMATHARGLVSMILSQARREALGLGMQPRKPGSRAPLYTASIEAATGTTTGISAEDRARTIRAAAFGTRADIITPGHIFPQVAGRDDHAQAAIGVRLLAAAGTEPAAAICTILDDAGEVEADGATLARLLGLAHVTTADICALSGPESFT